MEQKRRMRPLEKGVFLFLLAGGLAGLLFMFYLQANVDDWNVKQEPAQKTLSQAWERVFCIECKPMVPIRPTPS